MTLSTGNIAARLAALEKRHLPAARGSGVKLLVITCSDFPEPPEGSLDAFLARHPPCCERGWVRTVEFRDGAWCEPQPRCWACREEN